MHGSQQPKLFPFVKMVGRHIGIPYLLDLVLSDLENKSWNIEHSKTMQF